MNSNIRKEPEIKFTDLFFVSLKKIWIMLIVGAIVGGALFSYYVCQEVKTSDVLDITKKISASETDEQYRIRVQKIERARSYKKMIENTNLQIEYERTYVAESIYMQINPDSVYQSTAQMMLTLENNDTNGIDSTLFAVYEREIKSGSYLTDYAETIGTKPDYIKELISFSTSEANNTIISLDNDVSRTGTMYISVYGPTREFVDEVMDLVISEVNNIYAEVNSSIVSHSISLVGVQQIVKIDKGIMETQSNHTSRIQSLQSQIADYNNCIKTMAKEIGVSENTLLTYLNKNEEVSFDGIPTETSEKITSKSKMIKPNLKWLGIGFAIGTLAVFVIIVFRYIYAKKVLSQAQFFGLFPWIEKIGVMKPAGKRTKLSKLIDIRTEDDSKLSEENCNKLISANYSNLTKVYNKVLITGTADTKSMEDTVNKLGLKGDFKPDIFSNPDVLKTVPEYDAIVLIEQRKVSMYKTVKNEIKLLSNGGTEIIGAILI